MKRMDAPRRRARAWWLPLLATVAVTVTACSTTTDVPSPQASGSPAAAVRAQTSPTASDTSGNDPIVRVVEEITPAVVNVSSRIPMTNPFLGGASTNTAVGTGFVVRSDGLIVTNDHVVDGATEITVTLPDGTSLAARVVATDRDHDLAVLDVDALDLATVPLGDSSALAVGEPVVAIGYALDLEGGPTVTSGIISSLERTIEVQDSGGGPGAVRTYEDVLQTDAALNSGNSGGPLVTLDGQVVGVNAAGSAQAENIGFAVAINSAKPLIEQALGSLA